MKRILLLIAALVLALALAACGSKEPEEPTAEDSGMLTNSAQQSVAEASYLEYDNGQITCRFRRDEDGWKWVDNESFPLDVSYVEQTLTELETMSAALTPLEPTVEAADAGLEDPDRYLTVTVGEETTTLRFGTQRDDGQWYMSVDGQEGVYLASDEFMALMDRSVYSMAVLPTLPELTDDNLTSVTVRGSGEGQIARMTRTDEGWISENRPVPEKAAEIEAALAAFTFDSCFNFDPSPDAAPLCGLDAPTAVITAAYVNSVGTETAVILTLGMLREDGFYYVTLNDDTTVYLVSQDKAAPFLALL